MAASTVDKKRPGRPPKKRTRPRGTIPINELPRLHLLDDVYDSRQPEVIGKFQKWILNCVAGPVAQVKFPGRPVCVIMARYVRRYSDRLRAQAEIKSLCTQGLTDNSGEPINREVLQMEAKKFGLTVEQYLAAMA